MQDDALMNSVKRVARASPSCRRPPSREKNDFPPLVLLSVVWGGERRRANP
jgi:hypothetical protein